jgi:broad specificity phosphatase PhoE
MIQTEEDELWREDKRESLSELNRRISKFWQWLGTRPEKNIAIVTHGVWIEECLRRNVPKVLRGGVRVQPADVFTCKVVPHVREEGPIEMHTLLIKDAKYDAVLSEADPNERGVKIGGD